MDKFTVIIPARMNSHRLAKKMLLEINGLPLIIKTANQALKSNALRVIVATDHIDIMDACKLYNIEAVMTRQNHPSGTDRITEVVDQLNLADNEIIINVQGDEPLIEPELINDLATFITSHTSSIATVAHLIAEDAALNPNIVKVVLDKFNNALYFSRSVIPFHRQSDVEYLRHIGLYAYTVKFLKNYQNMAKSQLEEIESLEQLRVLYNGYKIAVLISHRAIANGVDTLDDIIRIRNIDACYN